MFNELRTISKRRVIARARRFREVTKTAPPEQSVELTTFRLIYREEKLAAQRELIEVIKDLSTTITTTPDEEWNLGLARVRLEMLEGYWMDFQSNHLGLISTTEENGGYDRARSYTTTQQLYTQGKASIYNAQDRLMTDRPPLDGSDRTERLALTHSHSRLPRINVPEFTGKRDEWESFRDLFTAMIHNNAQLTNVEKLYYLKTLVKGDAEPALTALQLTDDNYGTGWNLLEDRFEHRRILVYGHLNELRNLKAAREESVKTLQTLVDTLRRHRDQLQALNRPVAQWDDWFVSIAAAAMDQVTRRAWEEELEKLDATHVENDAPRPGHELASFETLIRFLNSRCRSAMALSSSAQATTSSRPVTGGSRNSRCHATHYTSAGCAQCQADHYIGRCETFLKLVPKERQEKVVQARLCFNCLRSGHNARSCPSRSTCQKCQAPHHTLLHEVNRKRPSDNPEEQTPAKTQKITAATGGNRNEFSIADGSNSESA